VEPVSGKEFEEKLVELDKRIAKESRVKNQVKFCPACGSTKLGLFIVGLSDEAVEVSKKMKCVDCKAIAFPLSGTPEELVEFRKHLREKAKKQGCTTQSTK